ncbi:Type I phosphodiesterase / nucleotide pyrophosphatase [Actinokineospora alba]|uniref:Type I phosphodiesterase / nucleotide pyrophosphatase n=1 Tax=Actinokineospora alba TaxID=504798 RepID=A0A1H0W219_9PSEU|nr:alkaline phosphatase family protein [Actinokineospora alba]TDP67785.1 type I phosphodiesterase/nucleotide pyrophosphatase [Actinokineospora alba]SDI71829.1 Type I phosphodiesterase / nucleotide pyrophosphatase [Actinokineospora alba]SDP84752.1 Type I phosphodiesterase / nucleotide pyrophosphatase [Actinokineospora alba]
MAPRRTVLTLAGAAVLAAAVGVSLPTPPDAAANVRPQKVVVFGIDGLVFSKVAPLNTPTLDGLVAAGRFSETWLPANPMAPTFSGPGWSTIATGVWPDKHKVLSNNWGSTTNLAQYPDFLTRMERTNSAKSTFAIANWPPLTTTAVGPPIFTDEIDTKISVSGSLPVAEADTEIVTKASAHFKNVGPDASFVYFHAVDTAGHNCGTEQACYRTAIEQTDANLGKVINSIKSRANYANEDWTYIVTTDHGHVPTGGHGGSSIEERRSFVLEVGPGIPNGTTKIAKNVDIARTVLEIQGVPISGSWGLDGRRLGAPATDTFDTLLGSLKPRVDETGIPSTVLGWTQTPPTGWRIDNSRMGTGGMTEWRGWSFTTDEFWNRAQRDQWRENNVRARGVFAVADSDEWSDKTTSGLFDSTLVSRDYDVAGKPYVLVIFKSHYRKEGLETATMTVSFDGGPEKEIVRYTGDVIAKHEQYNVTVPAGASKMVVRWRLSNGDNDFYWAIDDPWVWRP